MAQLHPHVFRLERDEDNVVPFLPILEKLIVQTPPLRIENARLDELAIKAARTPECFLNDCSRSSNAAETL